MNEGIRELIVKEAQSCFYVHGFRKTTVDEIASHLSISKKTLYKYFSSKDELIKATIAQIMEPLITQINTAIEKRSSISEAVNGLFSFTQKLSNTISTPMLNDIRIMPDFWQIVEKERRKALEKLTIFLEQGKEDGLVRKDLDTDLFVKILINTFDTFAHPNSLQEMDLTPSEFVDRVFPIFMKGIMDNGGGTHIG